ncbi:MAG: Eco29kI family restriction endonuclease, partial [Blastocatellia bacterium]
MAAPPQKLEQLAKQLKELSELISAEKASELPALRARSVRKTITEAYERLRHLIADLDPIKHPGFVFDPSNPNVVGRIVGITMLAQTRKPLANIERFYGSGVYAIYYDGKFPVYKSISKREHPIYVGKADPADLASKTAMEQGDRLANRLNDHCRSIAKARTTLRLEDFQYRALVVQTGWQTSAEHYLIHLFKPIWNSEVGICYGFGKHGDAPETRANLRSPWDTLHPGRDWAHRDKNMKDAKSQKQIVREIRDHLAKHPP